MFSGPYTYCRRTEKQLVSASISRGDEILAKFMDSFEFNKIAGAVLGTALAVMGLREVSSAIYHTEAPEKPGYLIEVAETAPAGGAEPAAVAAAAPIGVLLASADAAKGANAAKACGACHSFDKGGANKVGPNLWDIVQRPIASHAGFAYSEALTAKAGQPWTYDDLNAFILNPRGYAPGTKMAYAGLKNDASRADLLAYLGSLSDAPKPFPAP
jgi:cytochrome c